MKSYNDFLEAVSARRLAELRAKGKGDAADAKMKADGLSRPRMQGQKEKARRVAQGNAGQNVGGALAIRPKDRSGKLARTARNIARDKAVKMAGDFIKRKAAQSNKRQVSGALAKRPGHREVGKPRGYKFAPDTQPGTRQTDKQNRRDLAVKKGVSKKVSNTMSGLARGAGNIAKGTAKRTGNLAKGIGKRNLKRANRFFKNMKVPSTDTAIGPIEDIRGGAAKKFGRSAS